MKKQVGISEFQLLLRGNESDKLLEALRKLTEVKDPKAITEAKGPMPLGWWAGWR